MKITEPIIDFGKWEFRTDTCENEDRSKITLYKYSERFIEVVFNRSLVLWKRKEPCPKAYNNYLLKLTGNDITEEEKEIKRNEEIAIRGSVNIEIIESIVKHKNPVMRIMHMFENAFCYELHKYLDDLNILKDSSISFEEFKRMVFLCNEDTDTDSNTFEKDPKEDLLPFSERAKEIGNKCEELVFEYLKKELPDDTSDLRWVANEGEKPGWDIQYRDSDDNLIVVEVKGSEKSKNSRFMITKNEWDKACEHKDNYYIYIVTDCFGEKPKIGRKIQNPAQKEKDGDIKITPIAYKLEF